MFTKQEGAKDCSGLDKVVVVVPSSLDLPRCWEI